MNKKSHSFLTSSILALLIFLFEKGLALMGYINPSFGWLVWGVCAILLWFSFCKYEWPNPVMLKYVKKQPIRSLGYIFIVLLFSGIALYVHESDKKLPEELSRIKGNEESRLDKEYPLGYIMMAFSGDRKIILPSPNIPFETDWSKIELEKINTVSGLSGVFTIPYLRDKKGHQILTDVGVGTNLRAGTKCPVYQINGVCSIYIECLKAEPIGLFMVLGFKEPPK